MSEAIEKQKRINKFWFWWNLIESIVLFAGGVLAIVAGILSGVEGNKAPEGVENAVAYAVAAFVILDGLLRIVMFLARIQKGEEQSPLVIAGFEISLGVLLILIQTHYSNQGIFAYMVVNLIAIVMMVMGALLLVYAIYVIAKKMAKLFMPVMEILFAAILVGVGVVIEVLYNTASSRDQLVLILIGTVLSLAAIGMFVITLITRHKTKKEIDKAEAEDRGDYEVVPHKSGSAKRKKEETQDYIDAEEVHPNPDVIEGPKAIENNAKK